MAKLTSDKWGEGVVKIESVRPFPQAIFSAADDNEQMTKLS